MTLYRSEDDLRAVFRTEAAEVPEDAPPMFEPARTARNGARRWAVPLAAAAAVAAIAVPMALVEVNHRSIPAQSPPRWAPLSYLFAVAPVPGWHISSATLGVTYQDAAITSGISQIGDVTLSAPEALDPTPIKRGEPVMINGRTGYFGNLAPVNTTASEIVPLKTAGGSVGGSVQVKQAPTVAWEIAPRQWATVLLYPHAYPKPLTDVRSAELAIAKAVSLITPRPLRLPFRTGWRPATAESFYWASTYLPIRTRWYGTLVLGHFGQPLSISEYALLPGDPSSGPFTPDLMIGSHPATFMQSVPEARSLMIDLGERIQLIIEGNYSKADLIHVAQSLALASNPKDPSTWLPQ
jgi:hypothetical protein